MDRDAAGERSPTAAQLGSVLAVVYRLAVPWRIWGAVTAAALSFGTGAVVTRGVLRTGMGPVTVAALRSLLAAIAVTGALWVVGQRRRPSGTVLRIGLVLSVVNFAGPTVFFTLALEHAGAGFVGLMAALFPLGNAVLAHLMLDDERLTILKSGGLVVGLSGVAVLVSSGDTGLTIGGNVAAAASLALLAVLCFSFGNVFARRHSDRYEPMQMTAVQFVLGSVWLIVAMLLAEGLPGQIGWQNAGRIGYLAVVSTAGAFLLQFWLLRHSSATTTSLVGYLVPLVALVLGLLFLDEQLQLGLLFGGVLIMTGVIITERARIKATPMQA